MKIHWQDGVKIINYWNFNDTCMTFTHAIIEYWLNTQLSPNYSSKKNLHRSKQFIITDQLCTVQVDVVDSVAYLQMVEKKLFNIFQGLRRL